MSLQPKFDFGLKLNVVHDVLCADINLSHVSKRYDVSTAIARHWLLEIFQGDDYRLNHQGEIFLKDENHLISGYNEVSRLLGSIRKPMMGLSDYDITPEFADDYIANGEKVKNSKTKLDFCVPAFHSVWGWTDYQGSIYPLMDDNGDVKTTVIICNLERKIAKMDFATVIRLLRHGYAKTVLNRPSYIVHLYQSIQQLHSIFTDSYSKEVSQIDKVCDRRQIKTVIFTRKEVECLLNLLVGFSYKSIALHMQISVKTVEKMVATMNQKVGSSTSKQLIDIVEASGFFATL